MMNGNWFGNNGCSLLGAHGGFTIWHGLMILGALIVIGGIFLILKGSNRDNNALELLKIQYVNGNITEEAYLNRKNVLER